jgi:hypothetical protein
MAAPRLELEAWFDDSAAWAEEHQKRMIARLCDLGAASRKRGDAVAAAADYNRALAYAPSDPHLLRIVSSMHRAEARMRVIRRAAPLALATVALGASAYFVARAFKPSPLDPAASVASAARPPVSVAVTVPLSQPVVSVAPPPDRPPFSMGTARGTAAVTSSATATPPPKKERYITITQLKPPFGVYVSIDNGSPVELKQGKVLTVDEKEHSLSFTCATKEWCAPNTRKVAAGGDDDSFPVTMEILPARLVVEGEPGHVYILEEIPNLPLQVGGAANSIPMTMGETTMHVYDRADPKNPKPAPLKAGQLLMVSFRGS